MNQRFIPYGRQAVDDADVAVVIDVLRSDWLTTGPAVERFEAAIAETTKARFAICCANGTAALHIATLGLGVEGQAVVVPSVTFLASANSVRLAGGEVVFADVDSDSGLMMPNHLEQAMKRAEASGMPVKAVMTVHLGGQSAARDEIAGFARNRGISVIEDAAHAIGAAWRGAGHDWTPIGGDDLSDAVTFSFHPVKSLTTAEGGALTTNDETLANRFRLLRNHGMERNSSAPANPAMANDRDGTPNPWYYEMREVGLNYRLNDLQCALGLSQIAKLERFLTTRAALAARYDLLLADLAPVVRSVARSQRSRSGWHLYSVLINFDAAGKTRAAVMNDLRARGIGTQVHYIPVHRQPYYRARYGEIALPGADRYYERTLSLPLFVGLTEAEQDRVVASLRSALGRG